MMFTDVRTPLLIRYVFNVVSPFSVVLPLRLRLCVVSVALVPAGRRPYHTRCVRLQRDLLILRTFLVALPPVLLLHPRSEHSYDQRDCDCTDTPSFYCITLTFSAMTLMYPCLAFDVV